MKRRINALLVDAGGVLVVPDPAAVRIALSRYGACPDDGTCLRAHYFTMRELERCGTPDWARIDRTYARIAGVAEEHRDNAVLAVADIYRGTQWVAAPGAARLLRTADKLGIPTVVVSNAYGTMERILGSAGVCSTDGTAGARVAAILDSDVIGLAKPAAEIFLHAAELIGRVPEECAHVGDTVVLDVRGAQAAGMSAIHLDPFSLCPDDDHMHVARLEELADPLARVL